MTCIGVMIQEVVENPSCGRGDGERMSMRHVCCMSRPTPFSNGMLWGSQRHSSSGSPWAPSQRAKQRSTSHLFVVNYRCGGHLPTKERGFRGRRPQRLVREKGNYAIPDIRLDCHPFVMCFHCMDLPCFGFEEA